MSQAAEARDVSRSELNDQQVEGWSEDAPTVGTMTEGLWEIPADHLGDPAYTDPRIDELTEDDLLGSGMDDHWGYNERTHVSKASSPDRTRGLEGSISRPIDLSADCFHRAHSRDPYKTWVMPLPWADEDDPETDDLLFVSLPYGMRPVMHVQKKFPGFEYFRGDLSYIRSMLGQLSDQVRSHLEAFPNRAKRAISSLLNKKLAVNNRLEFVCIQFVRDIRTPAVTAPSGASGFFEVDEPSLKRTGYRKHSGSSYTEVPAPLNALCEVRRRDALDSCYSNIPGARAGRKSNGKWILCKDTRNYFTWLRRKVGDDVAAQIVWLRCRLNIKLKKFGAASEQFQSAAQAYRRWWNRKDSAFGRWDFDAMLFTGRLDVLTVEQVKQARRWPLGHAVPLYETYSQAGKLRKKYAGGTWKPVPSLSLRKAQAKHFKASIEDGPDIGLPKTFKAAVSGFDFEDDDCPPF